MISKTVSTDCFHSATSGDTLAEKWLENINFKAKNSTSKCKDLNRAFDKVN